MNPRDVVIVSACRTPIGKNMGQFKDVRARQLAITAGAEAIKRADIDPKLIDGIVMGECFTAMEGHETGLRRKIQRLRRQPELRIRHACSGHPG